MITRDEYLDYGLERVDFDNDRAFLRGQGQNAADKSVPNKAYDYDAECDAAAKAVFAKVAPTITPEDMPQASAPFLRESQLRNISKGMSEKDLADVSTRALALEVRDPLLYWQKAYDDCIPILHKQAHALNERLGPEEAEWSIMHITWAADHIHARTEKPTYMRGDRNTLTTLSAATLDVDADYSAEERKTLLAHLIMHSRVSSRAERQFQTAAKELGPEAAPIVALIEESGVSAEIMARADHLASLPKDHFAKALGQEQVECLTAIETSAQELSGGHAVDIAGTMLHDRVRLRACSKMVEQSGSARPDSPDFMALHRKTNAALLREFPLGAAHQVTVVSAEIARTRVEAREATISKLLSARHDRASEK